jgi:hypothetical protein
MASITMNLRVAERKDFLDMNDRPIYGTIYFVYSRLTGEFDRQPYYYTENTEKTGFRELFRCGQIYVPVRIFDEVQINN